MSTIHCNKRSPQYISSGAKCVWKTLRVVGLPLLNQVFSFFLVLCPLWTSLQDLQVVWSPWQSFFLLRLFVIWGPLECCVSTVCVGFNQMYMLVFSSTWWGYPTAIQHCSHNQSRHPEICYITFYFKASFQLSSEASYSIWIKNFAKSQPQNSWQGKKNTSLCLTADIISSMNYVSFVTPH